MFDKLSDYLYYLLPGPLKRQKKENQLGIFLGVIGGVFDDIREDILRLRQESIIFTASPCMLDAFGQERGMFRLAGETEEEFRFRLLEKADVAALSGSEAGILLALKTVGYPDCTIEPLYKEDADRWAEIYVSFHPGSVDTVHNIDFACIKREVCKTKQAGTLPHYRFYYEAALTGTERIGGTRTRHRALLPFFSGTTFLNGTWRLDGQNKLDAQFQTAYTVTHRAALQTAEEIGTLSVTANNNLWYLDGAERLNGAKKLSAYVEETNYE